MVSRLDRDLGRLLDLLDELGLSEQTLVVFTSDNGPHSAGGIGGPAFFESAGGLAGAKRSLFEGGIRVPALARWPGTVAAGRTIDEPVGLWDLLPTFLELAGGVASPPEVDGLSLAPLLAGEEQPPHDEAAPLYWESWEGFRGQAVRLGRWKAVRTRIRNAGDPVRLFDLAADLGEQDDLAGDPALCGLYLRLVRLMNASRTDPGGFAMPPLALECPAAVPPPRVWGSVAPSDAAAGSTPRAAADLAGEGSRWRNRGLGCPPRRGVGSGTGLAIGSGP
jgi:arylsulfatase A-like enzyme